MNIFAIHTILASLVVAAPVAAEPEVEDLTETAGDDYSRSLEAVADLSEKLATGDAAAAELIDALAAMSKYPVILAADEEARAERVQAMINLILSYLMADQGEAAAGIMDELIRSNSGEELPLEDFLLELHDARVLALEAAGTAAIEVDCQVACEVYVNERSAEEHVEGLYLGPYRVYVVATAPEAAGKSLERKVMLDVADGVTPILFDPRPPAQEPLEPPPAPPERILSKGAEIGLLVVGACLLVGGVVIVGADPEEAPIGGVLIGLGSGAALGGGVMLSIDQVNYGKWKGQQAVLGWTTKF